MRFGHGVCAEMEDRGGKNCAGMTFGDTLDQMLQCTHPATGDDGYADSIGNLAGERQVIAGLRPVAVHRRHQQFTRSKFRQLYRVLDRIDALLPVLPVALALRAL